MLYLPTRLAHVTGKCTCLKVPDLRVNHFNRVDFANPQHMPCRAKIRHPRVWKWLHHHEQHQPKHQTDPVPTPLRGNSQNGLGHQASAMVTHGGHLPVRAVGLWYQQYLHLDGLYTSMYNDRRGTTCSCFWKDAFCFFNGKGYHVGFL